MTAACTGLENRTSTVLPCRLSMSSLRLTCALQKRSGMSCRRRQPQRAVIVGKRQGQAAQRYSRRQVGPQLRQRRRCCAPGCQALRQKAERVACEPDGQAAHQQLSSSSHKEDTPDTPDCVPAAPSIHASPA